MKLVVKFVVSIILLPAVFGTILFSLAGDFCWMMGWLVCGLYAVVTALMTGFFHSREDLARERKTAFKNAKWWDKILCPLIMLVVPLAIVVVSALEHRWGRGDIPGFGWQLIFLAMSAAGILVTYWAMLTNDFFSSVMRIQSERGQHVVAGGPYSVVRHPGYVGAILYNVSLPLALGSLWGLVPALIEVLLFAVRTALEDATLRAELPGYEDYTVKVRYRLIPYVW
jgi:protein-S-isoprenylcysteine O-methyltransferase Ste14